MLNSYDLTAEMLNLLVVLVTCLGTIWLSSRVVAFLVAWICKKYGKLSVRFGGVGFFTYGNILINRGPMTVKIERLWFSSCYFNKDVSKPLAICIGEMRLELDLPVKGSGEKVLSGETVAQRESSFSSSTLATYLSPVKLLGLHVDTLNLVLRGSVLKDCLLHITINEITPNLDLINSQLFGVLQVNGLVLKVLSTASQEEDSRPCLAEVSFSTNVQAELTAEGKPSLELVHATITEPKAKISEVLLSYIHDVREKNLHHNPREGDNVASSDNLVTSSPANSKLLTFLPKKVSFEIQETEISLSKDLSNRTLLLRITGMLLDVHQRLIEGHLHASSDIRLSDVKFGSQQASLAFIRELRVDAKVTNQSVDIATTLQSCFLGYHHEEVQYWLALLSKVRLKQTPGGATSCVSLGENNDRELDQASDVLGILGSRALMVSVKSNDTSAGVGMAACSGIKSGFTTLDFLLDVKPNIREGGVCEKDIRLGLEVGGLYSKLSEGGPPTVDLSPKVHHYNTLLYTSIFMCKVNKLGRQVSVDLMLDSVQGEVSTQSVSVISQLGVAILRHSPLTSPTLPQNQPVNFSSSLPGITRQSHPNGNFVNRVMEDVQIQGVVQCTNINIFLTAEQMVCTMLRVDSISIQQRLKDLSVSIQGSKVSYITQIGASQSICRSQDLHYFAAHLKQFSLEYTSRNKFMDIKLTEEVYVSWTTSLHMCVYQTIQDVLSLKHKLSGAREGAGTAPLPLNEMSKPQSLPLKISVTVRANALVIVHLSSVHKVSFSTPEVFIDKERRFISLRTEQFSIAFDQLEIFKLQGIHITSERNLDIHRQKTPSIQLPSNRAWSFSFDEFHVTFPHNYDFAANFEEVKNLNKWRKIVHNVKRKPFTSDSPLPPDISIKAKSVQVQLCDDPFEVKLGDQYELLVDEHLEKEKRISALEQRIQELRKRHGLLPVAESRVDELYSSLEMRSARVYIDRSQNLYASSPMRNRLFTWTLNDLDITALADPSLHGTENVVKHMKDIDPDSPYPEEGLEFVTLWCRMVRLDVESWMFKLRDFPLPMLSITDMHVWGRLVGAEQKAQPRALRQCTVEVGAPWGNVTVHRNMPALKFYHDFCAELDEYVMAYGPCWEPTWAQNNLSQNLVNMPSVDPSKPMPFWDKFRLVLHGRLTMMVKTMNWLYHVSLNPYNVTEFMDWHWTNLVLDWTNAKWVFKGDLDIYVKTASLYDDCRLLHLPDLCFTIGLQWNCLGDPDDHHSVMPCAPDKVPEYSMEEHDSFRAFRSQSFNISLGFHTKALDDKRRPKCLFYASTLRWMDKLKMCFARVSRPIRRGKLFKTTKPRKPQLTRHVRMLNASVDFHEFRVNYWMSRSNTHGSEMAGQKLKLSSGLQLDLVEIPDGLIHRPQASWSVRELAAELHDTTVWLHHNPDKDKGTMGRGPGKSFFLSVDYVRYQRAEEKPDLTAQGASLDSTLEGEEEVPRQKVQVYNLKAAWTRDNRDVALSLYDGYVKAANTKRNLSSEALKGFRMETIQTPQKLNPAGVKSPGAGLSFSSPMTRIQSGPAFSMLQRLVSESDSKFYAVHEELSDSGVQVEQLHGIVACQTNDVVRKNWHVELYNSQVLLRGVETSGYVISSAAKASLLSCEHKPVWRDQLVHSKTTLVGSIESMQYYATVESDQSDMCLDVRWLNKEHIETVSEAEPSVSLTDLANMIGSGQSVGGVVGSSNQTAESSVQLQRIISRCRCQFFYAGYGEMEDTVATEVPLPPPDAESDMMFREEGVDAFSLLHHDLNICTNATQYKMILDIINNLLLHTEPKKKGQIDKLETMRFQMQLASVNDLKTPISKCQENLRCLVAHQRQLERKIYDIQQRRKEDPSHEELLVLEGDEEQLERELKDTKEQASSLGEELSIRVTCYKEAQLRSQYQRQAAKRQKEAPVIRRIEVCFKHAEWRMTEDDGQIGIADLVLRNFLYTKVNREDESGSHQLELGFVKVNNIQPNPVYKDVLEPQDAQDRQLMLQIMCRFKAPVGGISIKEHFEVNVTPLSVQLTAKFYNAMYSYFFPTRQSEDHVSIRQQKSNIDKSSYKGSTSSLASYDENTAAEFQRKGSVRKQPAPQNTDVYDQMKKRAEANMFVYIKIPEVLLRVSYKGDKEKHITNIQGFVFLLPTLEYHNQAWTWQDLAIAVKNDLKKGLVSQAVKQKLHIRSRTLLGETFRSEVQEEENKAKLLLGAKLFGGSDKNSSRKTLFKSSKS